MVMKEKGLTEMEGVVESLMVQLDRGWQRRALVWSGQDDADARQALRLAGRRSGPGDSPKSLKVRNLLSCTWMILGLVTI